MYAGILYYYDYFFRVRDVTARIRAHIMKSYRLQRKYVTLVSLFSRSNWIILRKNFARFSNITNAAVVTRLSFIIIIDVRVKHLKLFLHANE